MHACVCYCDCICICLSLCLYLHACGQGDKIMNGDIFTGISHHLILSDVFCLVFLQKIKPSWPLTTFAGLIKCFTHLRFPHTFSPEASSVIGGGLTATIFFKIFLDVFSNYLSTILFNVFDIFTIFISFFPCVWFLIECKTLLLDINFVSSIRFALCCVVCCEIPLWLLFAFVHSVQSFFASVLLCQSAPTPHHFIKICRASGKRFVGKVSPDLLVDEIVLKYVAVLGSHSATQAALKCIAINFTRKGRHGAQVSYPCPLHR